MKTGNNAYFARITGNFLAPTPEMAKCEWDALCDPGHEPEPNDFVAVWLKGEGETPTLKQLVSALPPKELWDRDVLVCRQLNPEKEFSIPMNQVEAVHRVFQLGYPLDAEA